MTTMFFLITGVLALAFIWFLWLLHCSPRGFEDANGFHLQADKDRLRMTPKVGRQMKQRLHDTISPARVPRSAGKTSDGQPVGGWITNNHAAKTTL